MNFIDILQNGGGNLQIYVFLNEGTSVFSKHVLRILKSKIGDDDWKDFEAKYFGLILTGPVCRDENVIPPMNSTTFYGRQGLYKLTRSYLHFPNELFIRTNVLNSKDCLNAFALRKEDRQNVTNEDVFRQESVFLTEQNNAIKMMASDITDEALRLLGDLDNKESGKDSEVKNLELAMQDRPLSELATESSTNQTTEQVIILNPLHFENLVLDFTEKLIELTRSDYGDDKRLIIFQYLKSCIDEIVHEDVSCISLRILKSEKKLSTMLFYSSLCQTTGFKGDEEYLYFWNIVGDDYRAVSSNSWIKDDRIIYDIFSYIILCLNAFSFKMLSLEVLFLGTVQRYGELHISANILLRVQTAKLIVVPCFVRYTDDSQKITDELQSVLIICFPESLDIILICFTNPKMRVL